MTLSLVILFATTGLAGCDQPIQNPDGFVIVNDTSIDLVVFEPGNPESLFGVEANDSELVDFATCTQFGYVARSVDGREVASLSDEACPGTKWVIHGVDDSEVIDR
ncbi:MAG: hypothetical protein Q7T73_03475 [Beijerinckiaceae bacterium]|nr:hypothetical protein [Beijerinckiaceae bacterium]